MNTSRRGPIAPGRIAFSVISGLVCLVAYYFARSTVAASYGWDLLALVLGIGLIVVGILASFALPPRPELHRGEEILFDGKPSMIPALLLTAFGILLLIWGISIAADAANRATEEDPGTLYPLMLGLLLVGFGNMRFWWSRVTTYLATTHRIVRMHRLFANNVGEIPRGAIVSVERNAGVIQRLTNRGELTFRAEGWRNEDASWAVFANLVDPGGPGRKLIVQFTNIDAPGKVVDAIAAYYPLTGEED